MVINTGILFPNNKRNYFQGDWYHKNCFRCVECNRLLDSLTNNDGADGGLYCKKCYCVKYGPQTRSSDVDHKLIDLSTIKDENRMIRSNYKISKTNISIDTFFSGLISRG